MRLRAGVVALALGLLGVACTGEVVDGGSSADGSAPEIVPGTASESVPGTPPEGDPHGELACDEDTQAAIDATIDGQLAAFADGDYDTALGFATERFRAGTTAEAFGEVIESDYPALRTASGHTSRVCVAQDGRAQLIVEVEGAVADELIYQMAQEDGEWRIDVAARVPGPASDEPVPV